MASLHTEHSSIVNQVPTQNIPRSSIRSSHSISDSKKHGKTYSTDMRMIVYTSIVSRFPHRTFLDRQSGPHTEHSSIVNQVPTQNIPRSSVRSPHRTFLNRQSLTIRSPHRTFLDRTTQSKNRGTAMVKWRQTQ